MLNYLIMIKLNIAAIINVNLAVMLISDTRQ